MPQQASAAHSRGRRKTAALVITIACVASACATSLDDIDFTPPQAVIAGEGTTPQNPVVAPTIGPTVTPAAGDQGIIVPEGTGPLGAFTGLALPSDVDPATPALAVRIDNVADAQPQRGLREADIVVENLIEGGITRFLAVYHSQVPVSVGPVRSARSTDIDVVANFADPGFIYWASNAGVAEEIAGATAAGLFTDLGIGAVPLGYYREDLPERGLEQTGYVRLPEVAAARTDGTAPTPLFTYGGVAAQANLVPGVLLDWPAGQRASFVWNEATGTWLRSQFGAPHVDESGAVVEAANVIVMVTPYGVSAADPRSPAVLSIGAGLALILRDGRVLEATWERSDLSTRWRLVDAEGQDVPLAPGPTWIALVPPNLGATLLTADQAAPLLAEAAPLVEAG